MNVKVVCLWVLSTVLFGCDVADKGTSRMYLIILTNQRRYGKKLCLWETAVSV